LDIGPDAGMPLADLGQLKVVVELVEHLTMPFWFGFG